MFSFILFSTCGTAAACGHLWDCPLSKPRTWGSWLPWSVRLSLAFKRLLLLFWHCQKHFSVLLQLFTLSKLIFRVLTFEMNLFYLILPGTYMTVENNQVYKILKWTTLIPQLHFSTTSLLHIYICLCIHIYRWEGVDGARCPWTSESQFLYCIKAKTVDLSPVKPKKITGSKWMKWGNKSLNVLWQNSSWSHNGIAFLASDTLKFLFLWIQNR